MSSIRTETVVIDYVLKSEDIVKTKSEYDRLTEAEKRAVDENRKLNEGLKTTAKEGTAAVKSVSSELVNFSSIAKSGAGLVAGFFSVVAIKAFSAEVLKTTIEFDTLRKAINFTSGSMEVGSANFEFLRKVADRLGVSLDAASNGFKKISGSASQAGYSNKQIQSIFENTAKAVAAFGLNSEQASGVFEALSQIVSKGVVSMEELRQQLGERLPGVFSIAAKSMGLTTQEFIKLTSQGKITQEEFIIPFTKALGQMADKASEIDSAGKAVTRFKNAYDQLLISLGRSADEEVGVIGFITKRATNLFNNWAKAFETDLQKVEKAAGEGYQSLIESTIKDLPDAERESVRLRILEQKKGTEARKQQLQKQLEDEKKRYESLGALQKLAEGSLKTYYQDQIALQDQKLAQYNGELKALEEIQKSKDGIKKQEVKTLEQLENEYKARVKLLELDKKIADIRIQLATEEGPERDLKLLRNAAEFGQKRLTIDRFYAAQGVNDAVENAKIQVYIVRKQTDDIIVEIKRQAQEGVNQTKAIKAQLEKQIQDNDDYETKKEIQRQESLQKEAEYQKELVKLNQQKADAIKEIDKKSKAEQKALEKDLHDISMQEIEAFAYAAGEISDLVTNRRLDNIYREYTAFQKSYSEEVRLAGDNQQKLAQLEEKRLAKEKELRRKEFEAQQQNAIAQVIFKTAPIIAEYFATGYLAPAAIAALAVQAAQIAYIVSTPVPEFAEGTKGTPFRGTAIVGEKGPEKVVTESGRVYFTPGVATLAQFDEAVQIIPNNQLGLHDRQHLSLIYGNSTKKDNSGMQIVAKLDNIEKGLAKMPVAAISLDAKGFQKSIRTQSRTTTILNNRMKN